MLHKRVCRSGGLSISVSLEPLAHCRNASLSPFYRYYFGRCFELAELIPLSHSQGRFTRYCDRLHNFSVTIARCHRHVNNFFPRTARLRKSLPLECFPLTYDLIGLSLELTNIFYL